MRGRNSNVFKTAVVIALISLSLANYQNRKEYLELQSSLKWMEQELIEYEQKNNYMWSLTVGVFRNMSEILREFYQDRAMEVSPDEFIKEAAG